MKKFYSHYFVLALALTTTSVLTTSCAGNKAQKAQLAEIIEDVKKTLPVISHANRFYHDKNDKDAATVEMLENEEYLAIDEGSKKLFKYTLILENEKIAGFQTGCDDYMCKPFSLMELIARVRAVLRRSGYRAVPSIINDDGFVIDPLGRTVMLSGKNIMLTPRAFDLLYALASHPNQALSRNYLINEVWGEDSMVTNRTVDSHVYSLRSNLEHDSNTPQNIVTVYKVGYKWCNLRKVGSKEYFKQE
jgi:DNA-binding winged helix-turn-helix (wHTH) protein